MRRNQRLAVGLDESPLDEALESMGAEELRALVRGLLPWLDEKTHARLADDAIGRAARSESNWSPAGPAKGDVAKALEFSKAARLACYAEAFEVDSYLRQGSNAFLARDYDSAFQIFRAFIVPVSDYSIDVGAHEELDEVLSVDLADCAAQYVVAMYMTAVPVRRPAAVKSAIDDMSSAGYFWHPLEELERVAVEPLPDFDDFLAGWRDLVRELAEGERRNEQDSEVDRWLREVTQRLEGAEGLAAIARSTKRSDDFRAWCRALADTRDWEAALAAYEEAAESVLDSSYARGAFLDGAALATQELERDDLAQKLERAWREEPRFLRLRRWLGSASSRSVMRRYVELAAEACPASTQRQKAFLNVLRGESSAAADLLASAPGLGWSRSEHPGHILFSVFCRQLGHDPQSLGIAQVGEERGWGMNELELRGCGSDEPQLRNPSAEDILSSAGIAMVEDQLVRAAMLEAMRTAASKRLVGVTEHKRRKYYGHAASLANACAIIDFSGLSAEWLETIRRQYRRYPALQREFDK